MPGLDRYFTETPKKEGKTPSRGAESRKTAPNTPPATPSDLWPILQETVRSMILFPKHLAYAREQILPKHPGITPEELSIQLGVPLGVALVILDQLRAEREE